jgi:hypothetical protein
VEAVSPPLKLPFAPFQLVANYLLKWLCMQISLTWLLVFEQLLTAERKYLALTPRTRIIIGFAVMAYAGAALYLSDQAEETFNLKATEEEKKQLNEMIPKIRTVDRPKST